MKTLKEYVKENRINTPVSIQEKWQGERYLNTKAIFYDVLTKNKENQVFAFISYPTTPMPSQGYPAVLLIHGGGGQAYYEITRIWSDKGFVVIAPDFNAMRANSMNERQVPNPKGGVNGYGSYRDLCEEDTWAYFSVLSAMRAIDVLCSQEVVDKNNVFSCGLSWGGFLQLLLSAVDKRIKAASIIYSSAYVYDSEWGKNNFEGFNFSEENKILWQNNIDPKNYLSEITHPIFFTAGTNDQAFKMKNRQKTADGISATAYYGLRLLYAHSNFDGFEQPETIEFFKKMAKNEIPHQVSVEINDRKLTLKDKEKDAQVALCFTEEDLESIDVQQWQEQSFETEITIPENATAFFVVERCKDGTQWSSKMFLNVKS